MNQAPYRCIVFDLDDTLLDTQRCLVPKAAQESCAAMIEAGLATGPAACFAERARFIRRDPRGNVYRHLVETFGTLENRDPDKIATAGMRAFYERKIDADISLFNGAQSMLETLAPKYHLYLVTAGHEGTQRSKVEILRIEKFFRALLFVDPMLSQTKAETFRTIMAIEDDMPTRFLSVGNRVDTDLSPAKVLGWKTCWVKNGEYAHLLPSTKEETPDFEISSVQDLSRKCQL